MFMTLISSCTHSALSTFSSSSPPFLFTLQPNFNRSQNHMEHCLSHHKLLALPSPLSTLKPRLALNFAPKSQALTRRLTVVAGAGASSHCEFSSLNSPLDPRTRSGKDLSSVLQNHPQLFHLAVAQELKQLADQRQDARCRMYLSASSHEACLHRR
ncbi:hypothetical protein RchiOBHm_Chr6g0283591 [Rosa chinensis]|uniref:Uncharacterized protein n=1 Tax=Rosa chinensis TaxID=74649 RepID=A0A2P6PU18_ROSCH|nr:hypothetical protein RchiOBHm_Chr6g0283591 [Rosa chinensis]